MKIPVLYPVLHTQLCTTPKSNRASVSSHAHIHFLVSPPLNFANCSAQPKNIKIWQPESALLVQQVALHAILSDVMPAVLVILSLYRP
jgi:hypothetical protein